MSTVANRVSEKAAAFDVRKLRQDFPILRRSVHGKPLVYLDNAATAQKPQQVIDAISRFYSQSNSNVHRGVHRLSEEATELYERARSSLRRFIHAREDAEVVFVRGTTEAINLVAASFGGQRVGRGDEVLISAMEHHSNIVPWQMLCEEKGASLRVIPMNDDGELLLDEFEKLLTPRTRLLALVHVSNGLGSVNPVREMTRQAHERGIPVLLDGAQAVPHFAVNVQELNCDFYAFSGHKMFGPSGIGVLYGKRELLEVMPPYQGGGDMISSVTFEKTLYNRLPYKFEAGTPHIAGAVGLGAAVEYLQGLDRDALAAHERDLLEYATQAVAEVPGVRLIGTAREKCALVSFIFDQVHSHDVGTVLDREGVAVRTGHHCTQPVMHRLGVPATTRASFALYNTREEVDTLVAGLHKVREVLL